MEIKTALTEVINESGKSRYAVAKELGKGTTYIYKLTSRPTSPSYETITSIADVCGYDLALIKRDGSNTIILDPPSNE